MSRETKNFLDFWSSHKETILEGEIQVEDMEANYTKASATGKNEVVEVLYQQGITSLHNSFKTYIFNATGKDVVYIDSARQALYEVYNMFGEKINSGIASMGVNKINLPNGGMISIY